MPDRSNASAIARHSTALGEEKCPRASVQDRHPAPRQRTALRAGLAEFLKAGDHEHAGLVALRLEPVARAPAVQAAQPLRDDALGTDLAHGLPGAAGHSRWCGRTMAISRWPSCLISCSQPSPSGSAGLGATICRRTEFGWRAGDAPSGKTRVGMPDKIAPAGRIGRRQPARGCGASWNASRNQCPQRLFLQLEPPLKGRTSS